MKVNARSLVVWMVTIQIAAVVAVLAWLWIQVFYLGNTQIVSLLTFPASERPPVTEVPFAMGVHTFGDFLLPIEQARVPNPWIDYTLILNPYPSGLMALFRMFTVLPYTFAFLLFFVANGLSMTIPLMIASRRFPLAEAITTICILGLLSYPFVMTLDRANAQGLLVLPLYLFVVDWRIGRWRIGLASLIAAAVLKLYPLLLVVVFLVERRYRTAIMFVTATAGITVALFATYPYGLGRTLKAFFNGVAIYGHPTASSITNYNYSIDGLIAHVVTNTYGISSPVLIWLVRFPWICGILYFGMVVTILIRSKVPFVVRVACVLSVLTMVVPISYGYTLSFVLVVIAELLWQSSQLKELSLEPQLAISLALAVLATTIPWPIALPVSHDSLGTLVVPTAWAGLTFVAFLHSYGRREGMIHGSTLSRQQKVAK